MLAGSQIKTYGRTATECCYGSGHTPSDPVADTAVGGKSGTSALWTISPEVLHGFPAEWWASQSKGK